MTPCCSESEHEARKYLRGWWLACEVVGYMRDNGVTLELRQCRLCNSTLAKKVRSRGDSN